MAAYFCSDPHAFHGNIMKYCRRLAFMTLADREAFLVLEASGGDMRSLRVSDESIDNMNRGLADNINSRVGPHDVLWCLGDWVFGQGSDYYRRARWFRDQIRCRNLYFIWGNHDDRKIRDLFTATFDQTEIREHDVRITLNHYPMLTWNGQHHGSVTSPNIHLYGHVHALYQSESESCPVKYADAWPALDVGFDGHDYQVWSLEEILVQLRPKLAALEELKRERRQFDPFRGRGQRGPAASFVPPTMSRDGLTGPVILRPARQQPSSRPFPNSEP
jgi:calcineurin-like phosphoesterase family protein